MLGFQVSSDFYRFKTIMYKHPSAHYSLGMLHFANDETCESILDKFLSILSTLKRKLIPLLMPVLFITKRALSLPDVDGLSEGGSSSLSPADLHGLWSILTNNDLVNLTKIIL